jgi:hypothetical protein
MSTLLASVSTCEISDALIKLGVPHGGHIPDVHMLSPSASASDVRICAPAYTVQMVLASDTSAPTVSQHFVDAAPAGSIIVIDAPPRKSCLLTLRYPCSHNLRAYRNEKWSMGWPNDSRGASAINSRCHHLRPVSRPCRTQVVFFPPLRSRPLHSRPVAIHSSLCNQRPSVNHPARTGTRT